MISNPFIGWLKAGKKPNPDKAGIKSVSQAMEYKGVRQTLLGVHTMLAAKPGMGTNAVKYISPGLLLPNPASSRQQDCTAT